MIRPRPFVRRLSIALALALALPRLWAACHSDAHDAAQAASAQVTVTGRVVDATGAGIPQATLGLGTLATFTSAADGTFSATLTPQGETVALFTARAPGTHTIFRPLSLATPGTLALGDVPLREVMVHQSVTLPVAPAGPATVVATQGSETLTLSIGAGDLVDASGATVTGDIDVAMSYWHPFEDLSSAPALTLSQSGNQIVGLTTYGMASVEASQGGSPLSVAPGRRLSLAFSQPAQLQPHWDVSDIRLFVVDESTGLWSSLGGRNSDPPLLAYDASSGIATASLPHMSYWNLDGDIRPSNGGCVSGQLYNACAPTQPLSFFDLKLWFLSYEQVKDFRGRSAADGSFCIPTYIADWLAEYNEHSGEKTIDVHYLVTGEDINNTTMCNPLPASCRTCSPFWENYGNNLNNGQDGTFCNRCQLIIPGIGNYNDAKLAQTQQPTLYPDTCSPPTPQVELHGCTFCANSYLPGQCTFAGSDGAVKVGACSSIGKVYLRPPGCSCGTEGQACGSGRGCCPTPGGLPSLCDQSTGTCRGCTALQVQGSVCDPAVGCCTAFGAPPLVCGDGICGPALNL